MVLTRRVPHAGCAPLPLVGRGWGGGRAIGAPTLPNAPPPSPPLPPWRGSRPSAPLAPIRSAEPRAEPGRDMSALDGLGRYVAASGRERRCEAVRELVELHLIDTVGALIASTRTAEGLRPAAISRRDAGRADKRALALDLATRCALARASEIDDIHLPSMTTPGAIVIPARSDIGSRNAGAGGGVTAHDLTAAILAGYEAMTRLGRAIDGPTILYRGIWPTYFAAPFGDCRRRRAASQARRAGRPRKRAGARAHAGGAGRRPSQRANHVAMARRRHRRRQRACTRRSRRRWASPPICKLIEGESFSRIYRHHARSSQRSPMALGGGLALSETSFKPWCAARQTMAATQALQEILASGVRPQEIDADRRRPCCRRISR